MEEEIRKAVEESERGEVRIADDVVAVIAGLAAMEIDGVDSMNGNITRDLISKISGKSLQKGVKTDISDNKVRVRLTLNLCYGYNIMDVSRQVQERVKTTIESMTGFEVEDVNVRIASITMEPEA